jgi:hypothetical protein
MKPQDIIFFIVLAFLVYARNTKYAAIAGLLCLILAIPLFAFWIFFTAERLTWYSAAFFLLAILLSFIHEKRAKRKSN